VALDPRVPDWAIYLGTEMSPKKQTKLLEFLDKNKYVFKWSTSDLVRVNREIIEHKMQVNLNAKPKKQKLYMMDRRRRPEGGGGE
jgi:hypothetical protein